MKIIALIDNLIGAGGGFDQGLNAIVQMKTLCKNRYIFEAYTIHYTNISNLKLLGINAKHVNLRILDKIFLKLSGVEILKYLQIRFKLVSPLEKHLLKNKCDLVYFVTPSNLPNILQKLNYIYTLWDLCHREYLEFPEVREFNQVHSRDEKYKKILASALITITESLQATKKASFYYGIDSERFVVMPLTPSSNIDQKFAVEKNKVLQKYNLDKKYFFYPAQFWAHKNHLRILEALIILRDEYSWLPKVVFSGKDYGSRSYIEIFIRENYLVKQVVILGFVPSEHMRGLYENALAVVMPTYFGPSNLPPLEAWSLEVPLIYSNHLYDQAGDAALLVNPDCARSIADAMINCQDNKVRDKLIQLGKLRIEALNIERKKSENIILQLLSIFEIRKKYWN